MALPVSNTNVELALNFGFHGPFKSSGGAFYYVVCDATSSSIIEVWKATDPTSSFTEQDSANKPDLGGSTPTLRSMGVWQDGDELHISTFITDSATSARSLFYHDFDMSTDTWGNTGVDVDGVTLIRGDDDLPESLGTTIIAASDGDLYIFGTIDRDTAKGVKYGQVGYYKSTDGGATWGSSNLVAGGNPQRYTGGPAMLGDSDALHFIYRHDNGTTSNLTQRALNSSDTLQTARDTGFDLTRGTYASEMLLPFGKGISYDRGGTTRLRVPYVNDSDDLHVLRFDAAADPTTYNSDSVDTDLPDLTPLGRGVNACLAVDGSTAYCLHAKSSDNDLYMSDDGGSDTWTTPALTRATTGQLYFLSLNTYDRSGTKRLAHLWFEGTTVYYDEDDISAPASDPVVALFRRRRYLEPHVRM